MRRIAGLLVYTSATGLALVAAVATTLSPPEATAQYSPHAVVDGEPTAEVCSRFGYDLNRDRYGPYAQPRPLSQSRTIPAYSPPPPVPLQVAPPPPIQPRVATAPAAAATDAAASQAESVVVTGSRHRHPNHIVSAPGYAPQPQPAPLLLPPQDTARYPDATPNPIKRVADEPVSTFSIDVDTASYSNVRRFLTKQGQRPPRDAVRVEELVNYFDYDYPAASREEVFRAWTAVAPSPWGPGKRLLHVGLQGHELHPAERPPLNLVFLVDVSGSMQPQDRLPLAQKSLNLLVDQLRPRDRVSMVVYAGSAGEVLGPTGGHEKLRMRCAIGALQAGGSTAGGQGLELAYGLAQRHFDPDAVNRVVLLTDGDFNVGISDPEKLEDFVAEKRKTGIYLSVYGFGDTNYNDVMMQTLAQAGNGIAGYVDTLDEGRKVFDQDFAGSVFPIADDVKIQVEFNPARVSEYRLIGYETRMLNRADFNNDQVDAGEVGAGATVTALYEITPRGGPASVDPLRYQPEREAQVAGAGDELAFLRVRFKRPGMSASELRERPITDADAHASLERAPPAMRWAAAVAAYGQLLRGDPYLKTGYGWGEVQALARSASGADPYGLKREFLTLVDRARESSARADASGS